MKSIWMILKVFGDICVCFAILAAFPGYFTHSYSLFWPALLCSGGVGIASVLNEFGKNRLRWLGILLPLASLLLPDGSEELRILLPAIVYAAVVIFRGQFELEYYSYRQYFTHSMMLLAGLYLLLCAFSVLESVADDGMRTIEAQETLRYGLVYLLTGVLLLRQLRLGLVSRSQGSRGQMIVMVATTGLVILAFLAAEPLLRQGATALFKAVLTLLFSVIMYLLNGFGSLLNQVEIQTMNDQVQAHRENSDTPFMGPVVQYIQQATRFGPDEPSYWWVTLVVIVLVVAMFLLLKSFRRRGSQPMSHETVATVIAPDYGRKDSRRSNRGKVRHYYREFLRMERKRGVKLRKNYTTEDILQRISDDTNPAAAAELRQIYLHARYDEEHEVTPEQVEAAKNALRRSRGGQSVNA